MNNRLINIRGTIIDLDYVYKIEIWNRPDIHYYNQYVKDSHLICKNSSDLYVLSNLIPKTLCGENRISLSVLEQSVYYISLYIFNINQPESFYFAHEDDLNKFIDAYKNYKKVSDILEI